MPLIFSERTSFQSTVAVWEVAEQLEFFLDRLRLNPAHAEKVHLVHPRRALEWSASRYLLSTLVGAERASRCSKDGYGKPIIPDSKLEISISHSHGMAAVIVSDRPVGVDVQRRTSKIRRIHHKFVSETEQRAINTNDPDRHYHICWSAKESLFKVYARGQVDFRRHLFVDLPKRLESEGLIGGKIIKESTEIHCQLKYRFIQEHVLVYAIRLPDNP